MQITNNATYNLDTVWDTILSQFPFYVVIWGYFDRLKIILKAVLGPLASALQIFGMYFGSFRCATVIWLYLIWKIWNVSIWIHCVLFQIQIKKLDYIRKLNKNYYLNVMGVGFKKNFKNHMMDFANIQSFVNRHPQKCIKSWYEQALVDNFWRPSTLLL